MTIPNSSVSTIVSGIEHRKRPSNSTPRFWVAVASRNHVTLGVNGQFAQFSHGKRAPAQRLQKGDWIIYYSGKLTYGRPESCQRFTALGQVRDTRSIQVEQGPGFKPWRRGVKYVEVTEAPIRPLVDQLTFSRKKVAWAAAFRFGFFEISGKDFRTIEAAMKPG
jgi:hypothetical protein